MTDFTATPIDVTYKPSGIDWLGDIPSHWEVRRLKSLISSETNGVWGDEPQGNNQDIYCIRVADIDSNNYGISEEKLTLRNIPEKDQPSRLLSKGNLLIEKSGGGELSPVGRVVVYNLDHKAVCSNFMAKLTLNETVVNPDYLYFVFRTLYAKRVNIPSIKATTGIQNIDTYSYFSEKVALPPLSEQLMIVNHLNDKSSSIDTFLKQKQRFIDLLREQKQAIINEAVTKGLYSQQNRDSLAKQGNLYFADSAPWLADVPEHWEVRRLRYCTSKIGSGVTPRGGAATYKDDGVPLIRSQNVHFDSLDLTDVAFIDEKTHQEMNNSVVLAYDVLLNITGASLGRCCHVPETVKEANVNQHVCRIRPIPAIISSVFLAYCIGSDYLQNVIFSDQYGSSREGLTFQKIRDFIVLVPPLAEQAEIVDYIEREAGRIDTLVRKTEREMSLMQEYRQSMIAEAVTGKMTVHVPA